MPNPKVFPDHGAVAEAALNAVDPLALALMPGGWRSATVHFERAPQLRVARLADAAPYPDLGMDQGLWTAAASAAFRRLAETLDAHGATWNGSCAQCERDELQSAKLTLMGEDNQPAIEIPIRQSLARGQLVNSEVMHFLEESHAEWTRQQSALSTALDGMKAWRYDGTRLGLVFEFSDRPPAFVPAQILGSYSSSDLSWCWAWANRSYQPVDYEKILAFRDRASGFVGLGAIWRPGYFSDVAFANLIALLVNSEISGKAVFSPELRDGLQVFYALMDLSELVTSRPEPADRSQVPDFIREDDDGNLWLVQDRAGFGIPYDPDWQFTRLYPPSSRAESPFDYSVQARPPDPDGWIGVWFNRLPPTRESPQFVVIVAETPPLSFEEFSAEFRVNVAKEGGREITLRQSPLTIGDEDTFESAWEQAGPPGARMIRTLTAYSGGFGVTVQMVGSGEQLRAWAADFERVARDFVFP